MSVTQRSNRGTTTTKTPEGSSGVIGEVGGFLGHVLDGNGRDRLMERDATPTPALDGARHRYERAAVDYLGGDCGSPARHAKGPSGTGDGGSAGAGATSAKPHAVGGAALRDRDPTDAALLIDRYCHEYGIDP
jgi:hypothetical protein